MAAAMMVDLVDIELADTCCHRAFDIDIVIGVIAAQIAADLRAKSAVFNPDAEAKVIFVRSLALEGLGVKPRRP